MLSKNEPTARAARRDAELGTAPMYLIQESEGFAEKTSHSGVSIREERNTAFLRRAAARRDDVRSGSDGNSAH